MNAVSAERAALTAHDGQPDKGGHPYIFHPLAVSRTVAALGEDFEVVALLHDVWEDTEFQLRGAGEVGPEFGLTPVQALALEAITQNEGEVYFDYVHRCKDNFIARVVKIADLRHNLAPERMRGLPESNQRSMRKRYERALEILGATG